MFVIAAHARSEASSLKIKDLEGKDVEGLENDMEGCGCEHDAIVRQIGHAWGPNRARGSVGPNGVLLVLATQWALAAGAQNTKRQGPNWATIGSSGPTGYSVCPNGRICATEANCAQHPVNSERHRIRGTGTTARSVRGCQACD